MIQFVKNRPVIAVYGGQVNLNVNGFCQKQTVNSFRSRRELYGPFHGFTDDACRTFYCLDLPILLGFTGTTLQNEVFSSAGTYFLCQPCFPKLYNTSGDHSLVSPYIVGKVHLNSSPSLAFYYQKSNNILARVAEPPFLVLTTPEIFNKYRIKWFSNVFAPVRSRLIDRIRQNSMASSAFKLDMLRASSHSWLSHSYDTVNLRRLLLCDWHSQNFRAMDQSLLYISLQWPEAQLYYCYMEHALHKPFAKNVETKAWQAVTVQDTIAALKKLLLCSSTALYVVI